MDDLISVIVPVYNVESYLERCVDSIIDQTYKNLEILLIDDGSTDNTQELVKEWMSKDNGFEIRYIHKENGGMHTAHNVAYEHIDTLLNVCIDSDDCLAEDGINKIFNSSSVIGNLSSISFTFLVYISIEFS